MKRGEMEWSSAMEYLSWMATAFPPPHGLSPTLAALRRLSRLAETMGVGSEKLKKDTAGESYLSDRMHLTYGLHCNDFLTSDSACEEKAQFITEWCGLSGWLAGRTHS